MTDVAAPTRLLVSDLAPTVTTDLLRQHVHNGPVDSEIITDAKVLTKRDGTSRRIAFIGCRQHTQAQQLKDWLHGSWVGGSAGGARVKVDWAKDTADESRPRKRARLAGQAPPATSVELKSTTQAPINDERFEQFMSVMTSKRGRALEPEHIPQTPQHFDQATDQTAKLDQPAKAKREASQKRETTLKSVPDKLVRDDGAAHDDEISDLDYMARRMKRTLTDGLEPEPDAKWSQDDAEPSLNEVAEKAVKDVSEVPQSDGEDVAMVLQSGRLFCRNLAFSVQEDDLRSMFEPYGPVEEVHLVKDKATGNSKGLAYVSFRLPENAVEAFKQLDGRTLQGRLLHILPSSDKRGQGGDKNTQKSLKQARLAAKKADAGNAISWATLYMNSDAVVSSVASRLGISKAELLDPTSSDAAVRVALAETHVIAETRKYFEDEGVNVEALGVAGPRSSTTILVKNLPHDTSLSTLRALFEPFGALSRSLLAPAGTMAVVEFENAAQASDAWRGLAYKKVGSSVLFLEKAPLVVWSAPARLPAKQPNSNHDQPVGLGDIDASTSHTTDEAVGAGSTLFVKNIAFATSSTAFAKAFEHLPGFVFARLKTKANPKLPSQPLSMGFGFVGFKTPSAASAALKARSGFILDGHQLEVKFAERGRETESSATTKSKTNSTKLVIKNLPFEATPKEIRDLVSAYGQIKSVRLPRKFDRKTRGFAFLEFASHQDAEATLSALQHTHLLGRHLVIQWAEEDGGDIENLRSKVGTLPTGRVPQRTKFDMA
ncbi:Multiple RNA-binding domain-containing protein 1 [Microbotryomycetes sp. JL221]|nr:Multiple RNA-binding domain-containing protein 1 [Microbotryomycetes sp. JL221]